MTVEEMLKLLRRRAGEVVCKYKKSGEQIPKFYGIAYYDPLNGWRSVCYPIPLNFVMGWGRHILVFAKWGHASMLDRIDNFFRKEDRDFECALQNASVSEEFWGQITKDEPSLYYDQDIGFRYGARWAKRYLQKMSSK